MKTKVKYPTFKVVGKPLDDSLELALLSADVDQVESYLETPQGYLLLADTPPGSHPYPKPLAPADVFEEVEPWLEAQAEDCHEVYFGNLDNYNPIDGDAVALVAPCSLSAAGVFEVEE